MRFGKNEMRQLFESGNNTMDIAGACHCTEAEVYNHLHRSREGMPKPSYRRKKISKRFIRVWTFDQVKELHRLARMGLSARDIAKELGTTRNAVLGKCRREAIKIGRAA